MKKALLLFFIPTFLFAKTFCESQSEDIAKLAEQVKYWKCRFYASCLLQDYLALDLVDFWSLNDSPKKGQDLLFVKESVKSAQKVFSTSDDTLRERVKDYIEDRDAFETCGCSDNYKPEFVTSHVKKINKKRFDWLYGKESK